MSVTYHLPIPSGASKSSIEKLAEDLVGKLAFPNGGSLEELVSKTGGRIVFGSDGADEGLSGSIIARSVSDYTIFLSEHTSRQRDRFTIAHELGHLILHLRKVKEKGGDLVMRATRWIDEADDTQRRAEWEANWFAAAFLMPKAAFERVWRDGGVAAAHREFDVSVSAAQTRVKSLSLE